MQIAGHDIGVCSWSLQPSGTSDLIEKVKVLGLAHVQLGLRTLLEKNPGSREGDIRQLRASSLTITSTSTTFPGEDYSSISMIQRTGGFVPDEFWPQRREMVLEAAKLNVALGVKCIECHVGFVPGSNDEHYPVLLDRVRDIAHKMATMGIDLLMETGQTTGSELLQFLNDLNCRNTGVNYDPANMILYGTDDPIKAIAILGRHIQHVHVKDAVSATQPRLQWGKEVPLGSGEVNVEVFLDAMDDVGYKGVLCIEREFGADRIAEIRHAIEVLKRFE